jgi:hypothetical protein
MAKAVLEIRELKAKLAEQEAARTEPIAVIGMACRFPGASGSPGAFRQLMRIWSCLWSSYWSNYY